MSYSCDDIEVAINQYFTLAHQYFKKASPTSTEGLEVRVTDVTDLAHQLVSNAILIEKEDFSKDYEKYCDIYKKSPYSKEKPFTFNSSEQIWFTNRMISEAYRFKEKNQAEYLYHTYFQQNLPFYLQGLDVKLSDLEERSKNILEGIIRDDVISAIESEENINEKIALRHIFYDTLKDEYRINDLDKFFYNAKQVAHFIVQEHDDILKLKTSLHDIYGDKSRLKLSDIFYLRINHQQDLWEEKPVSKVCDIRKRISSLETSYELGNEIGDQEDRDELVTLIQQYYHHLIDRSRNKEKVEQEYENFLLNRFERQ